uniref:Peptidase M12A domain-containing protein n=1 Tax=Meloidogyne incognita TaxID=6306 RepID=A0A914MDG5_MELIC
MPVYYAFDSFIFDQWRERIELGLKFISDKTCIAFEKIDRNSKDKYILFDAAPDCGTMLGANGYDEAEHVIDLSVDGCPEGVQTGYFVNLEENSQNRSATLADQLLRTDLCGRKFADCG